MNLFCYYIDIFMYCTVFFHPCFMVVSCFTSIFIKKIYVNCNIDISILPICQSDCLLFCLDKKYVYCVALTLYFSSLLADFPANTNILYVDLQSAEEVASRNDESSLPGLVLNIKKQIEYKDYYGIKHRYKTNIVACGCPYALTHTCHEMGRVNRSLFSH